MFLDAVNTSNMLIIIAYNNSNQGRLFRVSKRLLNLWADEALPHHTDAHALANDLSEHFVHKITAIRPELDAENHSTINDALTLFPTSPPGCDIEFSEFTPLSEEKLRIIADSSTNTCTRDPLPSSDQDEPFPVITKLLSCHMDPVSL